MLAYITIMHVYIESNLKKTHENIVFVMQCPIIQTITIRGVKGQEML